MKNTRLLTIFVIVFVDLLGFSLILPLLPYYAESFGATQFVVGLLVASYAAAQLLGAPLLGRLSDRYGRRPILLVSVAGTMLSFVLLGFAQPIGVWLGGIFPHQLTNSLIISILFFSRILDGLTGGNITVAQAYITDITDKKNRAKGLGLIGAAFGLGFILGPAIGGALSQTSYSLPAFSAAAVSFVNWIAIFLFLPESLTHTQRQYAATHQRPPFNLQALLQALKRPKVGPLLHIRLFFALAFATFQSIFSLYAQQIGLSARSTGFVLAYVGILSVIVQIGLIGPLTRRFRENWLLISGLWIMMFALVAWSFTSSLFLLLVVLIPLALAGGVLNTVINSAISKSVSEEEVGGTLGLSASLESLSRVIAPSVGGFLLQSIGTWAPGVFSAGLLLWTITFTYRNVVLPNHQAKPTLPSVAFNSRKI